MATHRFELATTSKRGRSSVQNQISNMGLGALDTAYDRRLGLYRVRAIAIALYHWLTTPGLLRILLIYCRALSLKPYQAYAVCPSSLRPVSVLLDPIKLTPCVRPARPKFCLLCLWLYLPACQCHCVSKNMHTPVYIFTFMFIFRYMPYRAYCPSHYSDYLPIKYVCGCTTPKLHTCARMLLKGPHRCQHQTLDPPGQTP
jgi:hypothetical protein